MARIRTIKPDFFKNEQLAELSAISRLLFIGLWTLADREGRMLDRPKRIKAEIFPYDNVVIDTELSRLQSAGFIERYEVGELKVIQVNNFTRHQRITGSEATTNSELPAPPTATHMCEEAEGNTEENFGNTEETPRTTGREGKGKEGKGKDKLFPTPAPPDSSSVLKSIDILKEDCLKDKINFVEHVRRQNNISEYQVTKALEVFNDHLKSGGEVVKQVKDYRFHFQNWLKKQDLKVFRLNPKEPNTTRNVMKELGL